MLVLAPATVTFNRRHLAVTRPSLANSIYHNCHVDWQLGRVVNCQRAQGGIKHSTNKRKTKYENQKSVPSVRPARGAWRHGRERPAGHAAGCGKKFSHANRRRVRDCDGESQLHAAEPRRPVRSKFSAIRPRPTSTASSRRAIPNAAQVSYATAYYNAGMNVHPSEPNYVWAEAGSDFGVHTDADPKASNGNTFYDSSPLLMSRLTANGSTVPFWHLNVTRTSPAS